MLDQTVGRYRITEKIGAGGMGEIYAAVHELMGREAVVKVLLPEIAVNEKLVKRFFEEARAAAKIQNPGIVEVFDFGWTEDGRAYLVMEKLEGETLKKYLERSGKLLIDDACQLIAQLARVMEAAHQHGIVHRDLKPDNVFIVSDPEVPGGRRIKVLDFGLAKMAERKGSLATMAGAVFGTPAYMAPEQCRDAATVDHRADLYAIGCIFYRCLCGRPPFNEGGSLEVMASQMRDTPTPPRQREPSVPADIDDIIMRLLDKQPDRRYSSCREFVTVLENRAPESWALTDQVTAIPGDVTVQDDAGAIRAAWNELESAGKAPQDSQRMPVTPAGRAATGPTPMPDPAAQAGNTPAPWMVKAANTITLQPHANASGRTPAAASTDTEGSFMRGVTRGYVRAKHNPRALALAGVAFVALGLLGSWVVMTSLEKEPEVAVAVAPGPESPPEEISPEQAQAAAEFDRLLEEAQDALVTEEWGTALDKVLLTVELNLDDPDRQERARELRDAAKSELQNEATYERLRGAVREQNIEKIASYYQQIPDESTYKVKSTPAYVKLTREWLDGQTREARTLARKRKCEELSTLAQNVTRLFPASTEFDDLVRECTDGEAVASADKETRAERASRSERSKDDKDLDRLMQASILSEDAKASIKKGQYEEALTQCQKALKVYPKLAHARMLCAMAACKSKNRDSARYHHRKLSSSYKKAILQTCMAQGIDLRTPTSEARKESHRKNDKP